MSLQVSPQTIFEKQAKTAISQAYGLGLQIERQLLASEWTEKNRVLSSKSSAEPGPYRLTRTPYCREPLEVLSTASTIQESILMWGSQLAKSETGNNWCGYVMDNAPGPMLLVQPSDGLAAEYSKQRINPLIDETPRLSDKVADSSKRDGGNTVLVKEFQGGIMKMTGAQKAKGLASMPVRYLFLDEVDRYPHDVDGEGCPIALAYARTSSFGVRKKILVTSTPTIKGASKVEEYFLRSDQRYYHVPCPHCGHEHKLEFKNLHWPEGQPEKAEMSCPDCGGCYGAKHKTDLLENGRWIAAAPGEGKPAGFHLSSLYSPVGWFSWADLAREWIAAQGNNSLMRAFVNIRLAETWKEKGEAPDHQRLYERRERLDQGICPKDALILTAGVDVQGNRIESRVWAWGRNYESWLLDRQVFMGDPNLPDVWGQLWAHRAQKYKHELGGEISIAMMAVDTGYVPNEVYHHCGKQPPGTVMPVDGMGNNLKAPIGMPKQRDITRQGKRITRGVGVFPVGSSFLKSVTYGQLKLDVPADGQEYPRGFVHLPDWIDMEECQQLTAEELITKKNKRGYTTQQWDKHRDRNEALDCRNYATAAFELLGCPRWTEDRWIKESLALQNIKPPVQEKKKSYLDSGRKNKGSWL